MADKETPEKETPESDATDQEAAFWEKMDGVLGAKLDTWFEGKVKEFRATGSSRTGRTTLPGILANFMFGPDKEVK